MSRETLISSEGTVAMAGDLYGKYLYPADSEEIANVLEISDEEFATVQALSVQSTSEPQFWAEFQHNGSRTDYSYAFANWNSESIAPIYGLNNVDKCMYALMNCRELKDGRSITFNITNDNPNMMYVCVNCVNMTNAPQFVFAAAPLVRTYTSMYASCYKLKTATVYWGNGTADPIGDRCHCQNMFFRCYDLETIDFGNEKTGSPQYLDLSYASKLSNDSVLSLAKSLFDVSSATSGSYEITLATAIKNNLPADTLKIFSDKGWSVKYITQKDLSGNIAETNYYDNTAFKSEMESYGGSMTSNGITFTLLDDESIKVTGEATSSAILIVGTAVMPENAVLKLTGCPEGGSVDSYYLYLYDDDDSLELGLDCGSGLSYTNTSDNGLSNNAHIQIVIASGYVCPEEGLIFTPKLVKTADYEAPAVSEYVDMPVPHKTAFDNDATTGTISGVTWTYDSTENTVTLDGSVTDSSGFSWELSNLISTNTSKLIQGKQGVFEVVTEISGTVDNAPTLIYSVLDYQNGVTYSDIGSCTLGNEWYVMIPTTSVGLQMSIFATNGTVFSNYKINIRLKKIDSINYICSPFFTQYGSGLSTYTFNGITTTLSDDSAFAKLIANSGTAETAHEMVLKSMTLTKGHKYALLMYNNRSDSRTQSYKLSSNSDNNLNGNTGVLSVSEMYSVEPTLFYVNDAADSSDAVNFTYVLNSGYSYSSNSQEYLALVDLGVASTSDRETIRNIWLNRGGLILEDSEDNLLSLSDKSSYVCFDFNEYEGLSSPGVGDTYSMTGAEFKVVADNAIYFKTDGSQDCEGGVYIQLGKTYAIPLSRGEYELDVVVSTNDNIIGNAGWYVDVLTNQGTLASSNFSEEGTEGNGITSGGDVTCASTSEGYVASDHLRIVVTEDTNVEVRLENRDGVAAEGIISFRLVQVINGSQLAILSNNNSNSTITSDKIAYMYNGAGSSLIVAADESGHPDTSGMSNDTATPTTSLEYIFGPYLTDMQVVDPGLYLVTWSSISDYLSILFTDSVGSVTLNEHYWEVLYQSSDRLLVNIKDATSMRVAILVTEGASGTNAINDLSFSRVVTPFYKQNAYSYFTTPNDYSTQVVESANPVCVTMSDGSSITFDQSNLVLHYRIPDRPWYYTGTGTWYPSCHTVAVSMPFASIYLQPDATYEISFITDTSINDPKLNLILESFPLGYLESGDSLEVSISDIVDLRMYNYILTSEAGICGDQQLTITRIK